MSFHSLTFLAFLVSFFTLYWCLRGSLRLLLCLAASYFFYACWDVRFLALLAGSTLLDFTVGRGLERTTSTASRRAWLLLSVLVNLGVLATFKYFDFFSASLVELANSVGWRVDAPTLNWILPLGISFYTFQTLSYSIDVYRGLLPPERNLLRFATYVAFFPQLVAGPIVRAKEFLPQLRQDQVWSFDHFQAGFGLILLGFFKKLVIADNIAILVEHLFDNPAVYTAVNTAVVIVLYAFQIYGDFSGYSDIAIGIALTLGYVFPTNFRFPYFSRSFREFWTRWHITLSSWLRDYLYVPLGGNRGGQLATARNLMITMFLGGLWHGANFTFVIWGVLHGFLLLAQHTWQHHVPKSNWFQSKLMTGTVRVGQTAIVFACVCGLWVLFRASDWSEAHRVLLQLTRLDGFNPSSLRDRIPLVKACFLVASLVACELAFHLRIWHAVERRLPAIRLMGYACLLWMIALFGTFDGNTFIYFQF